MRHAGRGATAWAGAALAVALAVAPGASSAAARAPAGPPDCTVATAAAPVAWRAGAAGAPAPAGAVGMACEPLLVPVAGYGDAFARAWPDGVGGMSPVVFLPDGDAVAEVAPPPQAPGAPIAPGAHPVVQVLAPDGRVLWHVRLPQPGDLAAGPGVVAAQVGGHLMVASLARRHVTWLGDGATFGTSYQVAVAGSAVILLRTNGAGVAWARPPTVVRIGAQGQVLGRTALATRNPLAVMVSDGAFAYVLSGDRLFRVAPSGQVDGPYRLAASYDQMDLVGPGEVLVRSPADSALVRVGAAGATTVWTLPVPEQAVVATAGAEVVAGADASGPMYRYPDLLVWDAATKAVVRRIAQPGEQLLPLAAGPFGILALARAYPQARAGTAPAPARLELFGHSFRLVWSRDLGGHSFLAGQAGLAWTYALANATFLTTPFAPGMAIVWRATVSAVATPGSAGAYLPTGMAPELPPAPPTAIAGYAVFDGQTRIDATHPLVVDAAEAGQAIPLVVSPVDAAGRPLPARSPVAVAVTDGGAGGTVTSGTGTDVADLGGGWSGVAIAYAAPRPGRYVLSAAPAANGYSGPVDVAAPPAVLAGAAIPVEVRVLDGNGVPASLLPGTVVEAMPGSSVSGSPVVTPTSTAPGAYAATLTAGAATGAATIGPTLPQRPGGALAPPFDVATVPVADLAPPVVAATATVDGGEALVITAPAQGDSPVGYLVVRSTPSGPASGSGPLDRVVGIVVATGPTLTFVLPAGTRPGDYAVASLDADGVASAPAAASG